MLKPAVKHIIGVSAAIAILSAGNGWMHKAYGMVEQRTAVSIVEERTEEARGPDHEGLAEGSSKGEPSAGSTMAFQDQDRYGEASHALAGTERLRADLIMDARKYLGTPYVYGAKFGQTNTFDCSSFVKTVYAENGIDLPRVSRSQALAGHPVSRVNLQIGDLVFFAEKISDPKIGHVGIYVGDGMMIHTYGDGGVKYSTIDKGWWKDRYITARRLIH